METTVKQRLIAFIKYKKLSQKKFEQMVGVSNGYVNNIGRSIGTDKLEKIREVFPDLNTHWLINGGEGMLKKQSDVYELQDDGTGIVEDAVTFHPMVRETTKEWHRAPIIPATIVKQPKVNIRQYVKTNQADLEMFNVAVKDMSISMWHRMTDTSMYPRYYEGDYVAMLVVDKSVSVVPGNIYGVDTINYGFLVRILYPAEGGYIARAINRDEYPDFLIPQSEILGVFRKMMQVRF